MKDKYPSNILTRPFRATVDELEFYAMVANRWRTLSRDEILMETARLFHIGAALADQAEEPPTP